MTATALPSITPSMTPSIAPQTSSHTNAHTTLISHQLEALDVSAIVTATEKRLKDSYNLHLPLEEELDLLQQLTEFEMGRFMLKNKGLNGFWTAHMMVTGPTRTDLHPLEKWLLTQAPGPTGSQERYHIYQKILQENLRDNMTIASVPCGLMDVLLRLDCSHVKNVHLVGIDLDPESTELAEKNAKNFSHDQVSFLVRDAWNLRAHEAYDIIVSNGLNLYESDEHRLVQLYGQFQQALKPGGMLLISFLTPPPDSNTPSPWLNVPAEILRKQTALFADIINGNWQCYQTEESITAQLHAAGLTVEKIINDKHCVYPTIVARKA